jgi:integrase
MFVIPTFIMLKEISMALSKQAKTLTKNQQEVMLAFLSTTSLPHRNKIIFLLSVRAGLRAKEIAKVTWSMVLNAEGEVQDAILLEDTATKGRSGGVIWMNRELKAALVEFKPSSFERYDDPIIKSFRNKEMSPAQIVNLICDWYTQLGFQGCSSHSGRRTFITNAARKISSVGGSLKDVQMLARHGSLSMTQRYIEADVEAQKKIVQII